MGDVVNPRTSPFLLVLLILGAFVGLYLAYGRLGRWLVKRRQARLTRQRWRFEQRTRDLQFKDSVSRDTDEAHKLDPSWVTAEQQLRDEARRLAENRRNQRKGQ